MNSGMQNAVVRKKPFSTVFFFGILAAVIIAGVGTSLIVYAGLCSVVDQSDGEGADMTKSRCLGNGRGPSTSIAPPEFIVTCTDTDSDETGLYSNGPSHLPDGGVFSENDFNEIKFFMETLSQHDPRMVEAFGGKGTCGALSRAVSLSMLGFKALSTNTSTPVATIDMAIEIGRMSGTTSVGGTNTLKGALAASQYLLQFGLDESQFTNKYFYINTSTVDRDWTYYQSWSYFDSATTIGIRMIQRRSPSSTIDFIKDEFTATSHNIIGNDLVISFKVPNGTTHAMTVYALNTTPNPDGTYNIAFSDTSYSVPHYVAGRMKPDGTFIVMTQNKARTQNIEEQWKLMLINSVGATPP